MEILKIGMVGDDVETLQARLKTLGYLKGRVDGIFGPRTNEAVIAFQADKFGVDEADGLVGPKTWGALFPADPLPPEEGHYLRAIRLDFKDRYGNWMIALSVCPKGTSRALETLHVVTGQAYAQVFEKGGTGEQPGTYRPAPEGRYRLMELDWAGGRGNYSRVHNAGLGPVFWPFEPMFPTERGAFGIHLDGNRISAPGTAGCLGILTLADLKTVVNWSTKYNLVGSYLVIDWPGYGNPGK